MTPHPAPRISIVIPVYGPGAAIDRVMASLDAQTMPPEQYEVIFVDDGSPGHIFASLQDLAAARSNVTALQIEHSGWPSRPRNTGIAAARGEYLFFMDHDDSLYPDGLRRAYDYASAHRADILAIKESKTNDAWWGMAALANGNISNAHTMPGADTVAGSSISRLQPMMPHKFYRREMFGKHAIRFPEGDRVLWEDVFINVAAYRHSTVLSVLADTPVYRWHGSDTNTSHSFDHARADFWERIKDVLDYIAATLAGPEHAAARDAVTAWELGNRVIHRATLLLGKAGESYPAAQRHGLRQARTLLSRFTNDRIYAQLENRQRIMLHLIQQGNIDAIRAVYQQERDLVCDISATNVEWHDGSLTAEVTTTWGSKAGRPPVFRAMDDRVTRAFPDFVLRSIPPELTDITDQAPDMIAHLGLRDRAEATTWKLDIDDGQAAFNVNDDGRLELAQHTHLSINLATAINGHPAPNKVWDLRYRAHWLGLERRGPLAYDGSPKPSLQRGTPMVAYANKLRGLSLDLAEAKRSFVIDGAPTADSAQDVAAFTMTMNNVDTFGPVTELARTLLAVPEDIDSRIKAHKKAPQPRDREATELLAELAGSHGIETTLAADDHQLLLHGKSTLAAGTYRIYTKREGEFRRTRQVVTVDSERHITFR